MGADTASPPQLPQSNDEDELCSIRCFVSAVRQQWSLLLVIFTACLAAIDPSVGAKGGVLHYTTTLYICIVVIFVIVGLTIPLVDLVEGLRALPFHIGCQVYSLVAIPLTYYGVVYHWGWEEHIISRSFTAGVMAALCMPTTAFTCVLFTQQAGGDEAVAVVNAALGNIIGPVVAPLMAHALIGGHAKSSITKAAEKLGLQLATPLVGGVLCQVLLLRFFPAVVPHVKKVCYFMFNVILALVLYLVFCQGFSGGSHGITPGSLALMILWVTVLHLIAFAGAWGLGFKLDAKRRIAFALTSSQKTEGMAVAILALIFPDSKDIGVLTLPIVAYHSVQMAIAASIAPALRRTVTEGYSDVPPECAESEAPPPEPQEKVTMVP
eukprot:Sspe_Gene.76594::Locus_47857_Transcript_1_1_Confidence_1.000_Length_2876::g.76594::m.76594/K14347/SLC10A7, P7; solute carrier family 10 (sodium/bile acid cotransporter), member 7